MDAEQIRNALVSGSASLQQSRAQFERLREFATARQRVVQQQINDLAPRALIDRDAARRYQDALLENAQLTRVITPFQFPVP